MTTDKAESYPIARASAELLGRLRRQLSALAIGAASLFVTLLGLLVLTFVIGRLMPIDPAVAILGDQASVAEINALREKLGLNQPLHVQFWIYLSQLLQGDLGMSALTSQPVAVDIATRFPATFELAALGMIIGIVTGVPLGVWAAARQGSWIDQVIRIVSVTGFSVPKYWLALMSLLVFYVMFDVAPAPGRVGVEYLGDIPRTTGLLLLDAALARDWGLFRSAAHHAMLPTLVLAYIAMAPITRMTRGFMIDRLQEEYVITARVKGLSNSRVIWLHAFPNILAPLLTVIALTFGVMLEGSVLIEAIFAWPGLGKYIVDSLFAADLNGVMAGTLVIGVMFVALNISADVLGRLVDPRVR